jgi:hypothetical protein
MKYKIVGLILFLIPFIVFTFFMIGDLSLLGFLKAIGIIFFTIAIITCGVVGLAMLLDY